MDALEKFKDKVGEAAVLEQLAEECTELAHAALKAARIIRGENPTPVTMQEAKENLLEEIADLNVCLAVLNWEGTSADELEPIAQKKMSRWIIRLREREEPRSKEHPLRTRLQDFREKYPNAEVYPDGQPVICCARLGYRKYCGKSFDDNHKEFKVCFNCWNMPVEEDE